MKNLKVRELILLFAVVTLALLTVFFAINNSQQKDRLKQLETLTQTESIVGTYQLPNSNDPDGEYLVLDREGGFLIYRQPSSHYEGSCSAGTYTQDGRVLTLTSPDRTLYAVYAGRDVYVFSPGGGPVACYQFVTETPTYINRPYLPCPSQ